jgi:hypothetical protein
LVFVISYCNFCLLSLVLIYVTFHCYISQELKLSYLNLNIEKLLRMWVICLLWCLLFISFGEGLMLYIISFLGSGRRCSWLVDVLFFKLLLYVAYIHTYIHTYMHFIMYYMEPEFSQSDNRMWNKSWKVQYIQISTLHNHCISCKVFTWHPACPWSHVWMALSPCCPLLSFFFFQVILLVY